MRYANWWERILQAEAEQTTESGSQPASSSPPTPTESIEPVTAPPAEQTAEEEQTSADDWAFLNEADKDDDDAYLERRETEPPSPKPPEQVAESPKPPSEAPKPPEPPVAKPAEPPVPPTQPPAQPQAQKTPEQLEQERQEITAKRTKELEDYYRLPEDLAEKLNTEPELIIPTLLAKTHLAIEQAVVAQVGQLVGWHVQTQQEMIRRETEAKEVFYQAWPQLKARESEALTLAKQFGPMIAQNPQFDTAEKRVQAVGRMICVTLGVPLEGTPPASPNPPPQVRTPSFRPATPGGSGTGSAPPRETNEFLNLAQEFLNEDSGI